MSLQTKTVAIVTRSSRGIGAAIARRSAAEGFAVVVNYSVNLTSWLSAWPNWPRWNA